MLCCMVSDPRYTAACSPPAVHLQSTCSAPQPHPPASVPAGEEVEPRPPRGQQGAGDTPDLVPVVGRAPAGAGGLLRRHAARHGGGRPGAGGQPHGARPAAGDAGAADPGVRVRVMCLSLCACDVFVPVCMCTTYPR